MDASGKLVMESILETKASTLLQFLAGLRGNLSVTFEEGTWAAWLYDVLKPHVTHLVVCNPRKNALLKAGSKSDRIDARKLAELLRGNHLKPVYHGETGVRMLRELARSYLTIVEDQSRVMSRLKALYRSWGIACAGRDVYYIRHRAQWLEKLREPGVRRRAERLYEQLCEIQRLRRLARHDLLLESRKHSISSKLRQIPVRRADSGGAADCSTADAAPFSHQAATMGLQRTGPGDSHQRGLRLPRRPTGALEETGIHSWPEQGPQP